MYGRQSINVRTDGRTDRHADRQMNGHTTFPRQYGAAHVYLLRAVIMLTILNLANIRV